MQMLKQILVGALSFSVLFLLIALFLPATYHVERSVFIQQPVEKVYRHVCDLNYWAAWNPWTSRDSTVKNAITGSGREIGSTWLWEGEVIGTGSLTIQEMTPNRFMQSRLVFQKPQKFESDDIWKFKPLPEGTQVIWINEGELEYPVDRVFGLLMDSMLGEDFEQGLENLKQIAENS